MARCALEPLAEHRDQPVDERDEDLPESARANNVVVMFLDDSDRASQER